MRPRSDRIQVCRSPCLPLLICLVAPTACLVPEARYEEAVTEADALHTALVNLQTEIEQCEERRSRARAQLDSAAMDAQTVEQALSGLELELTVARRERDDAQELVQRLRGELARVGRDVRTFAGRNAQLQESFAQLETRVSALAAAERAAEERTELFSELAGELRRALAREVVALELADGQPVVRLLRMGANAEGLYEGGLDAVEAVGRVVAARATGQVEVRLAEPANRRLGAAIARALVGGGLDAARMRVLDPAGRATRGSLAQLVIELGPSRPTEIAVPR